MQHARGVARHRFQPVTGYVSMLSGEGGGKSGRGKDHKGASIQLVSSALIILDSAPLQVAGYTSEEVSGREVGFLWRDRPREPKGVEGRAPSPPVGGVRVDVT